MGNEQSQPPTGSVLQVPADTIRSRERYESSVSGPILPASPPVPASLTDSERTPRTGGYYFHTEAPNGGYGWIVVIGCFISHVVFGGIERSEGIFFLEFKEKFGRNAQLTSLPGALVTGLRQFVAPVAAALSYRFSVRITCLLGSALMFGGMLLNAFVTDFNILFLSHAILQGIGRGFLYTPSLIIVADYFDRKRGIANGLSTSGTGIGTVFLAPLLQFLFDFYGYTGAFMVIAALSLNTAISAMLYKPLIPRRDLLDRPIPSPGMTESLPRLRSGHSADSPKRIRSEQLSDAFLEIKPPGLSTPEFARLVSYGSDSSGSTLQFMNQSVQTRRMLKRGELDDLKKEEKQKIRKFINTQRKKLKQQTSNLSNSRNVNLLKNPAFIMFCVSITLFTAASKSAFHFMPALITSKGYTPTEAAYVLSMTGAADIIGRIASGLMFDAIQSRLVRPVICNVFIAILAVVTGILPLFDGYAAISLTCAVNSLLTGAYVSQKTVISMDVLGPSNVPRSIGFFIFFQGFGVTIGVPLMAAMANHTNSYDASFFLCGAMMIGAGFFMTLSNMYIRTQEREISGN